MVEGENDNLTLSQTTHLDSSKLKEFADDNFKFDENGRKFSKWEKTMWEMEKLLVTRNLSFCHSVFKSFLIQRRKNQGLFGKGLSSLQAIILFPQCFQKTYSLLWSRKNLGLFGKGLTKQQNFILDQVVSICRQRNKGYSKIDVCYLVSRKHCGRRRKCWFLKHGDDPSLKTLKMTLYKQRKSPTAVGQVESRG